MNTRNFGGSKQFDSKNFSLTITHGGKNYAICDNRQFGFLVEMAKHEHGGEIAALAIKMAENGEELDEHKINEMAAEWVEKERNFSTIKRMLARMTPEERKQWEASYRFTPFSTKQL
jgi:hypothetical protein